MPDTETTNKSGSQPPAPVAMVIQSVRKVFRQFLALLGLFLIMIGVPLAMLTPFPFVPIGLPVVIIGVVLLGRNSVWGHQLMEAMLHKWPNIERFAPNWLMQLVFGREKRPIEELRAKARKDDGELRRD